MRLEIKKVDVPYLRTVWSFFRLIWWGDEINFCTKGETYRHGYIVVYTEHDELGYDIAETDIVEDEGVVEGYLAGDLHCAEGDDEVLYSRVHGMRHVCYCALFGPS
jgi:hypothetical protein